MCVKLNRVIAWLSGYFDMFSTNKNWKTEFPGQVLFIL